MTPKKAKGNKEYRICTHGCKITHYENCETCAGFGVYSERPGNFVSSIEAHSDEFWGEVLPCPECGSTENGLSHKEVGNADTT